MALTDDIIKLINQALGLEEGSLDADSGLMGSIAEFDSMAVVTLITSMEEQYGIMVDDDEIDASIFETVASLSDFVAGKLN